MAFVKDEQPLPKIFRDIILKIDNNNGSVTYDAFKRWLYNIRIEKEDIKDIREYLEKQGSINFTRGNGRLKGKIETQRNNIIFYEH